MVGFKYRKGYDWLDSKFHCSYLESRGVPEINAGNTGKSAGNYIPFISGSGDATSGGIISVPVTSLPVTSCDATSGNVITGDVTAPHWSSINMT